MMMPATTILAHRHPGGNAPALQPEQEREPIPYLFKAGARQAAHPVGEFRRVQYADVVAQRKGILPKPGLACGNDDGRSGMPTAQLSG